MTPDLLPTVAHNVLRVLDGGDPDYIDSALSDYAWALVFIETGIGQQSARYARDHYAGDLRNQARLAIEIAMGHSTRLRTMDRETLRAELERVAQPMEMAA